MMGIIDTSTPASLDHEEHCSVAMLTIVAGTTALSSSHVRADKKQILNIRMNKGRVAIAPEHGSGSPRQYVPQKHNISPLPLKRALLVLAICVKLDAG
jgi:hypothetical protein